MLARTKAIAKRGDAGPSRRPMAQASPMTVEE